MNYTLITGASSGIGFEFARIFASHGHPVILVARSKDKLDQLKADIEKSYRTTVQVVELDLSITGAAQKLFNTCETNNWKVEILVNNAGVGDYGPFIKSEFSRQSHMIQLNITALTELTHLFLKGMIERKYGRILNVASTAAFQPGPLMSVYYATKAFVLSFSEALHEEILNTGVTVTALCPGPTTSGFQAAAKMSNNIPLLKTLKIPDSYEVAEFGYNQMMRGQLIAVHGNLNRVLTKLVGVTPRSWVRKLVKNLQSARGSH